MHSVYSSHVPQSPSCSYHTWTPCFPEMKMTASVSMGTERPIRIPSCGLILTIEILLAFAMVRRAVSIFPSIERRAFETACREIPRLVAMVIFGTWSRRSFQNSNHFSWVSISTCQRMRVDHIFVFSFQGIAASGMGKWIFHLERISILPVDATELFGRSFNRNKRKRLIKSPIFIIINLKNTFEENK